jgi:3-dehydroquinate dehydratase-2
MNIFILNGPNLNLLGTREPHIYGTKSYQDLQTYCHSLETKYPVKITMEQSNHEGVLIDFLQSAADRYDGVLFNAGAYTHYSYALHDAIASIPIPVVEVHLSDLSQREPFRQISVIRDVCVASVMGLGFQSYEEGLKILLRKQ